eukprot:CAMPEP_0181301364 /NCGR_PEP_ID=MMETSP1101-20121128/7382_1 /TAXON_ID=46948 /ORGANISM="Rhodomonas abbreviata, Strain Caron Lab Isolate" /LENGTH=183 /DNA_ID=CAMNT_0023406659 /DNA_START=268 /DNA_END=817 /DNA_ORIENTATION=-
MIGLDDGGKTSLLERIKFSFNPKNESTDVEQSMQLRKVTPTVGLNIARLEVKKTKVIIWDLGGQEGLRGIWDKYYPDTTGIMWVVDCANPSRFEESCRVLEGVLQAQDLQGVPLLVLATKHDRSGAIDTEDIRKHAVPSSSPCMAGRQVRVLSASALEEQGVADGLCWLLEAVAAAPAHSDSE